MFPVIGRSALQPAKAMGAAPCGDKNPTLFHGVMYCCSDMFVWMFLHQICPGEYE